jgi:hypothetical protein
MASSFIYWTSDGGGTDDGGIRVRELHNWIMQQGDADLIVYGGDIYQGGTTQDFAQFFAQMGGNVSLMCETAGKPVWIQSGRETKTKRPPA